MSTVTNATRSNEIEVIALNQEEKLTAVSVVTVTEAMEMKISNQDEYEHAGKYLVDVKGKIKEVQNYWKDSKESAKKAHQTIVDKEKAMLAPLQKAESIIKDGMAKYQLAVAKAKMEAEEEARKKKAEEAERLLNEAVIASEKGDIAGAEINMAMASMVEDMPVSSGMSKPTANGTSVSKTWKARIIDETLIPAYANGIELRKVNLAALNSLARMSKGSAQIPGVEFYEDVTISARA